MPYENFASLESGAAYLSDGTRLFNFSEVPEFTVTDETARPNDTWRFVDFNKTVTFTGTFRVTRYMKNYLKYGWRCRGPVRKRLLVRTIKECPIHYNQYTATKEMAENG